MDTPRWTDATVELLARELYDFAVEPHSPDAFDGEDDETRDACRGGARKFLARLADAGLLVEAGGTVECQWGNRDPDGNIVLRQDEADARWWFEQTGEHPAVMLRTRHTGGWREATS